MILILKSKSWPSLAVGYSGNTFIIPFVVPYHKEMLKLKSELRFIILFNRILNVSSHSRELYKTAKYSPPHQSFLI